MRGRHDTVSGGYTVRTSFPIIELPPTASVADEPVGSKAKFWFERDGRRGLFKFARANSGEDWSEVVAAEIAGLLGLPHADCDLASHDGRRGVISWWLMAPSGDAMVLGNEVLAKAAPDYPAKLEDRWIPQHTVRAVVEACDQVHTPPEWPHPPGDWRGGDLFVGYLLLDALIGNTDRHDQNWAWIRRPRTDGGTLEFLSPTFDHGSSLGRELSDDKRSRRLQAKGTPHGLEAYIANAPSGLCVSGTERKAVSPMKAFAAAVTLKPRVAAYWIDRCAGLDLGAVREVFSRVPQARASAVAADFATSMIAETQRQLVAMRPLP